MPRRAPNRVVIERVRPEIDAGRFPIKRTVGEPVDVTAWVHADGHDVLAVVLRWRALPSKEGERAKAAGAAGTTRERERAGASEPRERSGDRGVPASERVGGSAGATPPGSDWTELPMRALGNDEWAASFDIEHQQVHEYTVQAWVDEFESWRKEVTAKVNARQDVTSELLEGADHIRQAARRARAQRALEEAQWLNAQAAFVAGAADPAERAGTALDAHLASIVRRFPDRRRATVYERVLKVWVDRERAHWGAWYEMFPRSWGPDPTRSATFREAASHLPRVAAMGFDVVYLPPIHPIGSTFRKGRGNVLQAGPGDPGSPWAIGSEAGGHKAVDPGLGTLDDFSFFVEEAERLGMEIALDIAFQCSPDHPYVREHPEWFRHRPDGTIKYAENPPKKYQDIYPLNFDSDAWESLWRELKSVFEFWIARGVRIFRVDNPHTKPYPFWEWAIDELRRAHPDVIFLSEAFTRPKTMYYLAKLGFTQSYTYFTWRNTKAELTDYFTELTQTEAVEFFRPNLFANTPDILHAYLQEGGAPAFQVRLILAATLGGNYGIYSGFELAHNRAVPGTEEYLGSEKYEIRQWEWDRPGHIRDLVTTMNHIRREHPALRWPRSLRFCPTDNTSLLAYTKSTPDGSDAILVIVNLDYRHMQHGWVQLPLQQLGLPQFDPYDLVDLLDGRTYRWQGERSYVRLEPGTRPAHVLRLR